VRSFGDRQGQKQRVFQWRISVTFFMTPGYWRTRFSGPTAVQIKLPEVPCKASFLPPAIEFLITLAPPPIK
jgi:hypothetical protein